MAKTDYIIKLYPEAWFRVEYMVNELAVDFKGWETEHMDAETESQSEMQSDPEITGFIKWDGCCEFDYGSHYCSVNKAEQFAILIKEIYKFKSSLGGSFTKEDISDEETNSIHVSELISTGFEECYYKHHDCPKCGEDSLSKDDNYCCGCGIKIIKE